MVLQAMYIGKKTVDEKERTNSKTGETIPAFKGVRYMFMVNEWSDAIENGVVKLGDIVNVNIRNQDLNVNFFCRLEEDAPLPF